MGDRIGGYNNDNGESGIINEHVGIRLNARVLILYERDIGYVQGLISTINPKLAEDITYISQEKIEEFQKQREQCNTNYGIQGKNSFVYDFSQKFGDQLTFEFSGRFKQKQVKIPTLLKTRIGGAYALNVDTTYYYQNPNQILEDITVFQTDYTAFTKPIQSNSDDKQKISLTSGALHTIAGNTTQHKRTPVVSNSNINGNFSPTVQSSQPPVVHNQNSSPKKTTTLKPMPGPTIIPGSTFNGNQNNGQASSASPKETVTSKPTPGPTIIPGSTLNSNQNGTSKTSIITQSSSSDNSQSNNNTRSLLIGLAIVVGAIIGAVALYFFAPLILGVSVGVGAKLGLGIVGAGAGAGAAIGRGIGCLTDVVISCCSSKAHAA